MESQAPLLDTETTVTGTVIKQEQVTNLPLNVRQFMQMVFLSPFAIPASRDFRSTEVARDTAVPSGGGAGRRTTIIKSMVSTTRNPGATASPCRRRWIPSPSSRFSRELRVPTSGGVPEP